MESVEIGRGLDTHYLFDRSPIGFKISLHTGEAIQLVQNETRRMLLRRV